MDNLRWILLVAGLFFVLVLYLIGKNKRQKDNVDYSDSDDESPEFSANDWDDADEGVGDVRIIARDADEYDDVEDVEDDIEYVDDLADVSEDASEDNNDESDDTDEDVIVLTLLSRTPNQLSGDRINSAAQANGLTFGKMDIFHRINNAGQSIFSLANMVEPGNFDADTILDLKTPGITLFMQISAVKNPDEVFDEMLECAYHISEMLDAQLCNRKRQPITQSDAEQYRELVAKAISNA